MGYNVEDLFDDLITDIDPNSPYENFIRRFGCTMSDKKWLLVRRLIAEGYDEFEEGLREFMYSTYGCGYETCMMMGTSHGKTQMIGELPPRWTLTHKSEVV